MQAALCLLALGTAGAMHVSGIASPIAPPFPGLDGSPPEATIRIARLEAGASGTRLYIAHPPAWTGRVDLFACTNLLDDRWDLAADRLAAAGGGSVIDWSDAARTNPTCFFLLGDADRDTDDDGIPDDRERRVGGTDPLDDDTDRDGLPDGWETMAWLDPKDATGPNGADGDPDRDTLSNLEEYLCGGHPGIPDTVRDLGPADVEFDYQYLETERFKFGFPAFTTSDTPCYFLGRRVDATRGPAAPGVPFAEHATLSIDVLYDPGAAGSSGSFEGTYRQLLESGDQALVQESGVNRWTNGIHSGHRHYEEWLNPPNDLSWTGTNWWCLHMRNWGWMIDNVPDGESVTNAADAAAATFRCDSPDFVVTGSAWNHDEYTTERLLAWADDDLSQTGRFDTVKWWGGWRFDRPLCHEVAPMFDGDFCPHCGSQVSHRHGHDDGHLVSLTMDAAAHRLSADESELFARRVQYRVRIKNPEPEVIHRLHAVHLFRAEHGTSDRPVAGTVLLGKPVDIDCFSYVPGIGDIPAPVSNGEVRVTAVRLDADVDSDNGGTYEEPLDNDAEDRIEDIAGDDAHPGKLLPVNDNDDDRDGIPDWADGFGAPAAVTGSDRTDGEQFVPVTLRLEGLAVQNLARIRIDYPASDPTAVTLGTNGVHVLPPGSLRLWRRPGAAARSPASVHAGGDFVPSGVELPASALGFDTDRDTVVLYAEAVSTSAVPGDLRIAVRVDPLGGTAPAGGAPVVLRDAVRLTAFRIGLDADFNRDLAIDDRDRDIARSGRPFRFWVNDDRDCNEVERRSQEHDRPSTDSPNHSDSKPNTVRDLVDWFPVYPDLADALRRLGRTNYDVVLTRAGGGLKCILTDYAPRDAGRYQVDIPTAHDLADRTATALDRLALPADFVSRLHDTGAGMAILEATAANDAPLRLEIHRRGTGGMLAAADLPLRVSCVTNMFRYLNLLPVSGKEGGSPDRMDDPPNRPDAETNGRWVVFVVGFMEDDESSVDHACEIFKRLHWSGANSRFVGVSWDGNVKKMLLPAYHQAVTNALFVAPHLAGRIARLPGRVTLLAHSLGTMHACAAFSSGIATNIDRCVMLNAAIPEEAFDPAARTNLMRHGYWRDLDDRLLCSEWYRLFENDPTDARRELTWRGLFANIRDRCWNFYSSGEDVFEPMDDGSIDGIDPAFAPTIADIIYSVAIKPSGRYSWYVQEKWKGRCLPCGTDYGGWGFDPFYSNQTAVALNGLTDDHLRLNPVFAHAGNDAPDDMETLYAPDAAAASAFAARHRTQFLGEMLPATSLAAGRKPIRELRNDQNINMNDWADRESWPSKFGLFGLFRRSMRFRWLHRDHREVSFLHERQLYVKIVDKGGMR